MNQYLKIGIVVVLVAVLIFVLSRKTSAKSSSAVFFGDMSLPRGLRNNNPGNIRINAANDWVGKVPEPLNSDGAFEQFYEYRYGVRALIILLENYIGDGHNTVRKIVNKYAPVTENHTDLYVNFVSSRTGFYPDDQLQGSKEVIKQLVFAITEYEVGYPCVNSSEFNNAYAIA